MDAPHVASLLQAHHILAQSRSYPDAARHAATVAQALLDAPFGGCAVGDDPSGWWLAVAGSSGPLEAEDTARIREWMLTAWLRPALASHQPRTLDELGVAPESWPPLLAAHDVGTVLVAPFPAETSPDGMVWVGLSSAEAREEHRLLLGLLAGTVAVALGQMPRPGLPPLAAVLDALPGGCEVYDVNWRLQQVNTVHRTIFALPDHAIGWTVDEVVAHCCERVVQPEVIIQAVRTYRNDPSRMQRVQIETQPPERSVFERIVAQVRGASGPAGYLVLYYDMTETRATERLKDEFLSIASHELKTPLTSVKGFSQMLQRQLQKVTPHATTLKQKFDFDLTRASYDATAVREEADRLARLVDQLLDISRIQTGRLTLQLQPLDLKVLLPETLERLRMALGGRVLVYEGPRRRAPLLILGHADRLKQVLDNLVENAHRYSPEDQPITVRLQLVRAPAPTGQRVRITVEDHGIGIAPEDLNRIFERFYRVARPGAPAHGGLGLGLYISSEIVKQHHGSIWAESHGPGTGSRFCVELPLQPVADAPNT